MADQSRTEAGITSVHAVREVLGGAVSVEDIIKALTGEKLLAPLGISGVVLFLAEGKGLRRFAAVDMVPRLLVAHGYTDIDAPFPTPMVYRTLEPLFLDRETALSRFPRFWRYIESTDLSFGAWLPLITEDEPVGVLFLGYRDKSDLPPAERDLLTAVASVVAQSLKRAALYDQEHAAAFALQKAMLPSRLPDVSGVRIATRYRAASTGSQVGGDWYDALPLPHGRLGLVVGDVQGHEIGAAAVMGQVRTALRAYAALDESPDILMGRLDSFLCDLDTSRFATCLYAEIDTTTGLTRIVRAGHHGPVLRHSDGTTSQVELPGGMPLGLFIQCGADFPVAEFQLDPGDALLLCTDGLLQFYDRDVDVGLRRVAELMDGGSGDVEQLAARIIGPLDEAPPLEDDAAFLLVTRERV